MFRDTPKEENRRNQWFYLWRDSGVCGRGQMDKLIFTLWPDKLKDLCRGETETIRFYVVHPFKIDPAVSDNNGASHWEDSPNCIEVIEVNIIVDCRRLR